MRLLVVVALLGAAASSRAQRSHAPAPATSAVMSSDARWVASQADWKLRVWDRASGKLLGSIDGRPSLFRGAIEAGVLAGIADEKPVVWRGARFERKVSMIGLPKVTTFGRVFLSPDGTCVGVLYPQAGDARDPDSFGLWDTVTGKFLAGSSWDAGARVHGLVFGPGDRVAAFGDEPGRKATRAIVRLYRIHRGRGLQMLLVWRGSSERATYSAAISPDGKLLALGAGERLWLWRVGGRSDPRLLGSAATGEAAALFPRELRVRPAQIPGAHQLQFSRDGKYLAVLHGFGVTGVAIWALTGGAAPMKPTRWVRRPAEGGSLRQIGWDRAGRLWLITASYGPTVFVHAERGGRFVPEGRLVPGSDGR